MRENSFICACFKIGATFENPPSSLFLSLTLFFFSLSLPLLLLFSSQKKGDSSFSGCRVHSCVELCWEQSCSGFVLPDGMKRNTFAFGPSARFCLWESRESSRTLNTEGHISKYCGNEGNEAMVSNQWTKQRRLHCKYKSAVVAHSYTIPGAAIK